jgi:hypothetical protein
VESGVVSRNGRWGGFLIWKVEWLPNRASEVISLYGRCGGLEGTTLLDLGFWAVYDFAGLT